MVATLFYVKALPDTGGLAVVDGEEGFHAATVRRIRSGEELVLGDGAGGLARCVVEQSGRDGLRARVLNRWSVDPGKPRVTVVQALPKSERSELAIELATEAGANAFVPWQAARCVASWQGARAEKGLRRWRAVVRSAARQSRWAHIPPVDAVLSTSALTQRIRAEVAAGAAVLVLHESASDRIADVAVAQVSALFLVVGPEGGIAPDELAELTDAGAVAVRLGPQVLRTSTAAAVALGALGVLTPRWEQTAEVGPPGPLAADQAEPSA
ncbi:16S rRNA (uracil(1498)-N(3))-methyltransferase [Mycobacterium montefiorense]|uniref:Ribosomal RNA small subunit methyltransferase E n=1 Tax=Mycobacterium montefiorense TaxID=154654 RepID=A0AA37PRF1_9MYCO|nr:16S rRNA (uracil(1498)-N(3))-methyltransferase [Mycobacterium montefiorense]GBG39869.1 ribosomal RNA small subunit methyltransferase E [Mycobacterium montefiorense]GKU36544.1 ribosomal RNA small subunit methyltransferase E [Mycobacterium montefiorense]GKU38647.1 ribosomal RNA small subunit methyltransferase E [Mycobacterium montefiorense]GKU46551.1 ribosomal RNA small subunit methyltransferase E [Mycobacterium montefiorense]GKU48818.1 ribosomal RNA small subunit methyltransferase E [Mycobac